jgi:BNR repeat-containing family member
MEIIGQAGGEDSGSLSKHFDYPVTIFSMRCLKRIIFAGCFSIGLSVSAQKNDTAITISEAGMGWAGNSVNTVIFRKNALVSFNNTQYIAYYNKDSYVVIGKRVWPHGKWQLKTTKLKGNTADAHNSISIMTDGEGYLHIAWDHHNNALHYCKSIAPGSLELTDQMAMTGKLEEQISYPEFYQLTNGNLLFFYRNGESGKGNLVINHYNVQNRQWTQLHDNLIDGGGERNAYWQVCVDAKAIIHISWVWRESADVASNHDLCYACSKDGGLSWQKSNGEQYVLPIKKATAEYATSIPQNSELINQTSMTTDEGGHPYIASYWKDSGTNIPQYHIVYNSSGQWVSRNTGFRKTAFSLSGMGTKHIPIARPQIISWGNSKNLSIAFIFRDEERSNKVSVALCNNLEQNKWHLTDLTQASVDAWEPGFDTELWKHKKILDLFVQRTAQADAEGITSMPPQMVKVLEWKPLK